MTDIATREKTSTDVAPMPTPRRGGYASWPLDQRVAYANTLAGAADLIPRGLMDRQTGRPSAAKIFLVLETGTMLGLHPMAALQGIDVIEGAATITPRLFTGLVRSAGHKLRITETGTVEGGDLKVTVTLIRSDDPDEPITTSYTPHQALRAGLIDSYDRDDRTGVWKLKARSQKGNVLPWEAYTEDLCLWRALGRLGRRGAADVLMGIGYFPEELEAVVDDTGARVQVDTAAEEALIARIKKLDDKAAMAVVWHEHHPDKIRSDVWTDKVDAEFNAHLMRCTKDSRPPKDGAPGHTGDEQIDGGNGSAHQPDETPAQAAADRIVDEPVDVASGSLSGAAVAAGPTLDLPADDDTIDAEVLGEDEAAEYERRAAEQHAAWLAEQGETDADPR